MSSLTGGITYFTNDHAVSMLIRDYFAAGALNSVFKEAVNSAVRADEDIDCLLLAKICYQMADAMLEARKRSPQP